MVKKKVSSKAGVAGTGPPRRTRKAPLPRVAPPSPRGKSPAHDHLVRAFAQFAAHKIEESFHTLAEAAKQFPDDAAVRETLGVLYIRLDKPDEAIAELKKAQALGGDTPHVHDALCSAHGMKGDMKTMQHYGRLALEGKDRQFGIRPPLCALPKGPPPAFNSQNRGENVIAYCLWGSNPRYHAPLRETLKVSSHLFPGWTLRVYHDTSMAAESLDTLRKLGADLRPMKSRSDDSPQRRLLWRFDVCSDPTVKRFLVRDADSILSVKERVAVDAWLASDKYFHAMRDYFTHTDLLLAGTWGGVGGVLPPVQKLLKDFVPFRLDSAHVDQDLLTDRVWPTVHGSCLIHDSVFTGCLGSVPFPPYGNLMPGHHIGQNSFIHFRRS